jgi:hypothetical protein
VEDIIVEGGVNVLINPQVRNCRGTDVEGKTTERG